MNLARFSGLCVPSRVFLKGVWHHKSETDIRCLLFLADYFGEDPEPQERGADLLCAGKSIEVKFCQQWIKDRYARTGRRRGRFHLWGYERADFWLFVMEQENKDLRMRILPVEQVPAGRGYIPFPEIFPGI